MIMAEFNEEEYFKKWDPDVDYKARPDLYNIGKGQQGVLICEPYKSHLCAMWRFKTPEEARISAQSIYIEFMKYLMRKDFVGADMAKKYLHMGFTRARRYANHRDGVKYDEHGNIIVQEPDAMTCDKAESAEIFKGYWFKAKDDAQYKTLKAQWKKQYNK
jgi:hypothetical protein